MFHTPGIIKFLFPKDYVETKYNSIYEIPLIDINKNIFHFNPIEDKKFLIVHMKDIKADQQLIKKIEQKSNVKIYILPDQSSPHTFAEIKKVYPSALGKMIMNGEDAHPFAKWIKKRSQNLYDYQMFTSNKVMPFGIFQICDSEQISYYSVNRLDEYFNKLQKKSVSI